MTSTFTQPTKNNVTFVNIAKHLSTITESFILSEDGFKILAQNGDRILYGIVSPTGSGWTNSSKS